MSVIAITSRILHLPGYRCRISSWRVYCVHILFTGFIFSFRRALLSVRKHCRHYDRKLYSSHPCFLEKGAVAPPPGSISGRIWIQQQNQQTAVLTSIIVYCVLFDSNYGYVLLSFRDMTTGRVGAVVQLVEYRNRNQES